MKTHAPRQTYVDLPEPCRPRRSFALFNLGFRPLYLAGAAFGVVAIALWLAVLRGALSPGDYLPAIAPVAWHAHEMIFGFAAAVVVGFLLTAVRAWTGLQTINGGKLAALVALWVVARVLVWTGPVVPAVVADLAFLPCAAFAVLHTLRKAGNKRNEFLASLLLAFGSLNALFHFYVAENNVDHALRCIYAAIGIVTLFVSVIGGRVIPMFTANAIPGFVARRWRPVEFAVPVFTLLASFSDALHLNPLLVFALALAAFLVHLVRMIGWRSWRAQRPPILGVLHQAYAWIPIAYLLLAFCQLGIVSHTLAIHAFTFGAIGGAIIAMITRTARGHTGLPLIASRKDMGSYQLVMMGAVARVFGPILVPSLYLAWIDIAGACWILVFAIYVFGYARALCRPRADGKPG